LGSGRRKRIFRGARNAEGAGGLSTADAASKPQSVGQPPLTRRANRLALLSASALEVRGVFRASVLLQKPQRENEKL